MKNNNLLEKIQADKDFEKNAAAEVKAEIDREMKKSVKNRDYDKIAALSAEYNELIGADKENPQQEREAIERILAATRKEDKNNIKLHKRLIAVAASVIVLFVVKQNILRKGGM